MRSSSFTISYWVNSTFLWLLFIMLYKIILTFKSVNEILQYHRSKNSHLAVLLCGTVYYAVQGGSNF